MNRLRFGIAGLGFMGRSHLARLNQHPRAEVVALCDRDEPRRRGEGGAGLGNLDYGDAQSGRAATSGLRAYATWQELVVDEDIDVILVALPTPLHADVSIAALDAGKHVLCEKPMGYRPADCDRMIRAQAASGRTLMVAQCIRFWPQYETIRRIVDEGRVGGVRFVTMQRTASAPAYSADNWLMDAGQSGGAWLDLHVHDVDFAQDMLGVPARIYARGTTGPSGGFDHIIATYGYADGRYALLEGGWAFNAPWPFDMSITVHGERGTLDWRMTRGSDVLLYAGGAEPERIACSGDALRKELDYFIECVQARRPVERCLPASTRTSIVLAWLERRSAESGKLVHVGDRLQAAWGG